MKTADARPRTVAQVLRGAIATFENEHDVPDFVDRVKAAAAELEGAPNDVLALCLDADPVFGILGTRNVSVLWNYGASAFGEKWKSRSRITVGELLSKSDRELMRINNFGTKGVERVAALRAWVAEQSRKADPPLSDADLLDWVMEHTAAGYRNEAHPGMTHAVQWLDENGDEECTFSDSYRSAIRKAMGEGRASDAGSEVGTSTEAVT